VSVIERQDSLALEWMSLAHELSLNLIENVRTSELYQAHWSGRPMTSPIFNFYSLCTVGR
jgi:hypothetical protein